MVGTLRSRSASRTQRLTDGAVLVVIEGSPRSAQLGHKSGHGKYHETHLPSFQGPPGPHPWLSRPHEVARRPGGNQRPSRQGSQAPGRLSDRRQRSMPRRHAAVEVMERLVVSADFERVLRSASRASTQHFAVHHLPGRSAASALARLPDAELSTATENIGARPVDDSSSTDPARHLGAVVPKRHARRSVTRSLLKRQIYAAGDRHAPLLAGGLWIVRLRAPFDRAAFPSAASFALRAAARSELESLFRAAARSKAS